MLACAVLALCGSALAPLAASADAPPAPAVSVFPIPGARFASPGTQIAFRGISASRLGQAALVVRGSRSGYHSGKVVGDSDGQGASFLPARQFTAGEVVTVTATGLNVLGAGAGYRFTVANPASGIPYTPLPTPKRVPGDVYQFRSRADLPVAVVRITKRAPRSTRGDIFIAPQNGPFLNGPMIVDASGGLVWFKRVPSRDTVTDFRPQTYLGKPVLTWWQGLLGAGVGVGEDIISDASYRVIHTVRAANGLHADLHEFELTGRGSALISAYYPVYTDASSIHGRKRQIVLDSVVQKIDVATGLVLFQWDSLDHVSLGESKLRGPPKKLRAPFDYFHVNSVQEQTDGNMLISARNTWAAYKVDIRSGAVLWRLGGKRSSFGIAGDNSFAFQHDVRMRSSNLVTIFDDGAGPPTIERQSRGLELRLDFAHKTATRVVQYKHNPPLLANFEGNLQRLPGGDAFLGWGQQPYFTEFDSRGRQIFDGRFVDQNSSYRVYRFIWNGKPSAPPALTATGGKHATAYASWNGATNVAVWKALGGSSPGRLRFLGAARRQGFETAIPIRAQRYVAVLAVDRFGHRLGASATVRAR